MDKGYKGQEISWPGKFYIKRNSCLWYTLSHEQKTRTDTEGDCFAELCIEPALQLYSWVQNV